MTTALASAGLAEDQSAFRLVLQSIGTASPGNAAAIAVGLNVPVTTTMEALYRAPSVLIDGLSEDIGRQMKDLLCDLGCRVSLEPTTESLPVPAQLFDVALYVTDTSRYADISAALATFLGTDADEAGRVLSTPPGIALGNVSQATIQALSDRLGEGVDLIASDPEDALYDVFLGPCDAAIKSRLLGDLKRRGLSLLAEEGCILRGLTKTDADSLWATHQRIKELRVINRDFLRFDLVLTGGAPSERATHALTEVAGIPPHIIPRLFEELEITVIEAVGSVQMLRALEQLTESGLTIRADLITFLHLGVDIVDAPNPKLTVQALQSIGLDVSETDLRRLPYRLPYQFPEFQARMVRDILERSGAGVELIDPIERGDHQ